MSSKGAPPTVTMRRDALKVKPGQLLEYRQARGNSKRNSPQNFNTTAAKTLAVSPRLRGNESGGKFIPRVNAADFFANAVNKSPGDS